MVSVFAVFHIPWRPTGSPTHVPQEFCDVFEEVDDAYDYVLDHYNRNPIKESGSPSSVIEFDCGHGKEKFFIKRMPYENYIFEMTMKKRREAYEKSLCSSQ